MPYLVNQDKLDKNFRILWSNLHNDVVYIRNSELFKSDAGKRLYIKSVVTLMEGISYLLRQYMINDNSIALSLKERILLLEISTELSDSGEIKTKPKQYNSIQMFKFTFKTFGKYYQKVNEINEGFSNHHFEEMRETVKKRNHLTHPKSINDFNISIEDIEKAMSAHSWLYNLITISFDKVFIEKVNPR